MCQQKFSDYLSNYIPEVVLGNRKEILSEKWKSSQSQSDKQQRGTHWFFWTKCATFVRTLNFLSKIAKQSERVIVTL